MGLKEFVVAFNATNLSIEDAVQLARNIHKEIKSERINTEDEKIHSLLLVCLKATNMHLKNPEESIVSLGQACILTLAAIEDTELSKQLCLLRYNFIRKLITCKQFGSAQFEAMSLSRLLCTKHSSPPPPSPSEDDIKLLIGVLLTLLICETEPSNQQTSPQQLDTITQFVDVVHPFLQDGALSSTKETLQHCTSLSTYLYKIAMKILHSKRKNNYNQLDSIITRMVLIATSSSSSTDLLERVISWVGKLAAHCPLPDIASQIMSNSLYKATDGLSDAAALLIVDAMCEFVSKTIQHQQDMLMARPAVAATMIDNILLSCHIDNSKKKNKTSHHYHHHHHHPVLYQTVLLIPALVPFTLDISSSSGSSIETKQQAWVAAVEVAIQQQQEMGAHNNNSSTRCIQIAAEKCINVVRRIASGKLGHASHQTLFIDAFSHDCQQADVVASVLEVLCNHNDGDKQSASTNHPGIVALSVATKLRASAALNQAKKHHNNSNKRDKKVASLSSLQADDQQLQTRLASSLTTLLGWSFPCLSATEDKVATVAVSSKEVAWLSATLFNIAVDCIAANQLSLAIPPLQAAVTCSLELLKRVPNDDKSTVALKDAVRRAMAVIDTQKKAGDGDGAIDTCIAAASYLLAFSKSQGSNNDGMAESVLKEVGGLITSTASGQQEAEVVARRLIDSDDDDGSISDGAVIKAKMLMVFYSLGLNIGKDMLGEAGRLAAKGGDSHLQAEIEAVSIINKFESLAKQQLNQAKQQRQERATQAAKEAAGPSHPPPEPQPLDGRLPVPDLKVWTPLHDKCINVAQKIHRLLSVCEKNKDDSKAMSRLKALYNDVAALLSGRSCSSGEIGGAPGDKAVLPSLERRLFGSSSSSWHARDISSCVVDITTARQSMEAAVACARNGGMVTALVSASEAHKSLSQALQQQQSVDAPASSCCSPSSASWWQLSLDYLECLILLGRLFEQVGLPDEALQALKEGQRLASSMGCSLISAHCCTCIASILYKQDLKEPAALAVDAAEQLLELELGSTATTTRIEIVKRCLRLELDAHQALVLFDSSSNRQETKEALVLAQTVVEQVVQVLEELDEVDKTTTSGMAAQLLSSSCKCHTVLVRGVLLLSEPKNKNMMGADTKQQLTESLDVYQKRSSVSWPETVVQALLLKSQLLLLDVSSRSASTKLLTVWGVGESGVTGHDDDDSAAAVLGGRFLLWKALSLSRELPVLFKQAAQQLAFYCGRGGFCHLAAVLLHGGCLGATMRLQHRFVLAAKQQKMDGKEQGNKKAQEVGGGSASLAEQMLDLDALDWQHSIEEILGGGDNTISSGVDNDAKEEKVLKLLDDQAKNLLSTWLAQLHGNITVTSINSSRNNNAIIISRLAPHSPPVIITLPVSIYTSSSSLSSQFGNSLRLDNHPIKSLNMTTMMAPSSSAGIQTDEDDSGGESLGASTSSFSSSSSTSAVESVLVEFDRILLDSGDSMKNMSVETKEEQRAWWRRRMELDDALGCLVQFVDDAWLGPWKCLLHGTLMEKKEEGEEEGSRYRNITAVDALLQHLGCSDGSSGNGNEDKVTRELIGALVTYGSTHQMTDEEMYKAAKDLCHVFMASSSRDAIDCTIDLLRRAMVAVAGRKSNDGDNDQCAGASCESTPVKTASQTARSLDKALQEMRLNDDIDVQQTPAAVIKTGPRGNNNKIDTHAATTTTARGTGTKTRSRLASMMKTSTTVRPTTARKATTQSVPQTTVKKEPRATTNAKQPLQRQRAAPDCVSKFNPVPQTAPPPQGRGAAATCTRTITNCQYHPVVLVLDGALQCLPWEASVGLKGQHVHRVPSLPSAAAAASTFSVDDNPSSSMMLDLSCTYYALNPSGDLTTTQATFEPWFSTITSWQGRSGQAPPPTELTTALETRSFFIYLGHGGGEQYLPSSRLRALNNCAASLLMGCSSGRLGHKGRWYEPSGVILAYMLGGCPSAVANLWDVTDRDIDRFSQALLTSWMSGGGGGDNEDRRRGVAAAVNDSRDACKLKLLVGAAPVCYGLPAAVSFSRES